MTPTTPTNTPTNTPTTTTTTRGQRSAPGHVVLWASAFVLAALVIMQAGRLPENRAYGDMAVSEDGFVMLTARSGRGAETEPYELLYVLDSRSETLLVYDIEDARKKQIQLREVANLPAWFLNARR